MSVILGGWNLKGFPFSPKIVHQTMAASAWWNPDKQGHFHEGNVYLAHQLLATKPNHLQETQPFYHSSAQVHIIADVRLDNRAELINKLGINKNNAPDYELIVAAYLKFGSNCVQHLIGAFAFAIWDKKKQQFFCARDQMGIKPFYYYFGQHYFLFGSQKKNLLTIDAGNKTPNWRYIFNKFSYAPFSPESTEYKNSFTLLPGHYLIINRNGLKTQKYWELAIDKTTVYQDPRDYTAHFLQLFKQSIADRMVCSQKAGTHLSGGLDSSGITAIAHEIYQHSGESLPVFSYSVPRNFEAKNNTFVVENLLVYDVLDYCNLNHFHNVTNRIHRNFKTTVEEEAIACDGQSQSSNVNTEYELQAAAQKRGVEVLLSGFPGDELVTSFARSYYLEYLERGNYYDYFFNNKNSRRKFKEKWTDLGRAYTSQWFPQFYNWIGQRYVNNNKNKFYVPNGWAINRDYFNSTPELQSILKPKVFRIKKFPLSLKESQRNHICRVHTSRRMVSENLAGLRFKVEYRYPMADIRLLQYVLSVPMEQKITPTTNRSLYRNAMKGYLPDSIRLRDDKYSGMLKPLNKLQPRNLSENSKLVLWKDILSKNQAPFLNIDLIEKYFHTQRSPYVLYKWMLLTQLGLDGKMDFQL